MIILPRSPRGACSGMRFSIRGKNIDVTGALKEYVEKKVGKLEKYFDMELSAHVALSVEKDRHIVEVTVPLDGIILRGEEENPDMYTSIDLVVDKLERQVKKYKTKINRKLRHQEKPSLETRSGIEDEDEPRVVRVKRFPMKPMSVEEALMQMNLVGHDFFVFCNADTERVNVVYRRKDGDYGLIEPDE